MLSARLLNNVNDFFSQVITEQEGNLISSPLSVHIILSYLSHGAGGETVKELLNGLDIEDHSRLHTDYQSLITALNVSTRNNNN